MAPKRKKRPVLGSEGSSSSSSQPKRKKSRPAAKRDKVVVSAEEVCIPVVVGSIARRLKKPDGDNLFEWVLYLRSTDNSSLAPYIKKVEFQLHEDMKKPVWHVLEEPYEVYERGWGSFDVNLRVHMREEVTEEKMSFNVDCHGIVLEPEPVSQHCLPGDGGNGEEFCAADLRVVQVAGRKDFSGPAPVVAEKHDELIIPKPSAGVQKKFAAASERATAAIPLAGPSHWPIWRYVLSSTSPLPTEKHQLARLDAITAALRRESKVLENRLEALLWQKAEALQLTWHAKEEEANLKLLKKAAAEAEAAAADVPSG